MKSLEHWFKRKRYGYGSTPATVKGWLIITTYLFIEIALAMILLKDTLEKTFSIEVGVFLAATAILTTLLVLISSKKSPSNKWRWGRTVRDIDKEDL
ncbi:MAG: hypothetical protein ACI9T8_000468 [Candidatus Saccharimonadales bacterium]|jgi:hypothetical protein